MGRAKSRDKTAEEHIEQRKRQILDAAIKIFSRKGFFLATTDDIIKQAGIGKGTIYRYFKNKEELFLSVIYCGLEQLRDDILKEIDKVTDPLEKIKRAVTAYLLFFEKNPSLVDLIVRQHSGFKTKVRTRYFEHFYGNLERGREIIRDGIKKELVKEHLYADDIIWILMSIIHGVIHHWYASGKNYSLSSKAPVIMQMVFCGIVKDEKRRKEYEKQSR